MDDLDREDFDERVVDEAVEFKEISVGSSFSSFEEFKDSFKCLKKEGFVYLTANQETGL